MQVFQCAKCGHNEMTVQMREVHVTVGWKQSQFLTACPVQMCAQCGEFTTPIDVKFGEFVPLRAIPRSAESPAGRPEGAPHVDVQPEQPISSEHDARG